MTRASGLMLIDIFVWVCFLNESIHKWGHMKSCIGLLERKLLLLCWIILNGYQAGSSTVYSTLETCKSLSFGSHKLHILQPFLCVCGIWSTQSVTRSPWMSHRWVFLRWLHLCSVVLVSFPRGGKHSYLWFTIPHSSSHSLSPYLPLSLSPCCSHPLPNTAYSQVPYRGRQQAGMPSASPRTPLRAADIIAPLPGDCVRHINTFTHTESCITSDQ